MKINSLQIKDFRNHKETAIVLDRINFFVGHNNAGKSSTLAAIEWGLTGRCLWTDKAGRGASDLIRQGEKQAEVMLDIEDLGGVVRSLPPHTLHVNRISGVNEGQIALQNHLGVDESRLQIALNANAFLAMSQSEQRSFLFSAYGLSWSVQQVAEELLLWLGKEKFKDEDALRLAAKAKRYYPKDLTAGPEIFEAMEKRAKEERKELKKDKQQVEAALAELGPATLKDYLPQGITDSKEHLAEMRSRRDEVLKACGASRESQLRRQALQDKIIQTEDKISETHTKAARLSSELQGLQETTAISAEVKAEENIAAGSESNSEVNSGKGSHAEADTEARADETEKALHHELVSANKAAAAARSKLEALNRAGHSLNSEERRCPLAPDFLTCGLSKEQLDTVLVSLRNNYKLTSQELDNHEAAIKDTTDKLAALRLSQENSRARAKRVLSLQSEINSQHNLLEPLEANLADLNNELHNLPDGDEGLLEELAQLEAAISQTESVLAQFDEAKLVAKRRESLLQDIQYLTAQVADLETLVKTLGPDGLRKDLLAGILEGFVGRVNDRLGRLTEGTYHISLGPDMTLLCCANGGPFLPLKLLSKSEQLRVGIAISEALSAASGLKFLAIDQADMLDQENRDLLTGMLLDTAEEFDQVMVFTTVGDVQPQNPGLPGVKMFWVEDGTVHEL